MKPLYISRSVIVGLFIFLGLVIFVSAVFTIGNQQKTFAKTITLKVIFEDVNGLQQGNNVWLSGVKIGTVKKLKFLENTDVEVTMNIESQAQAHIKKDAKAKISSDGLIGNRIIIIYGGTSPSPIISESDFLKTEKSIGTDDMLATLKKSNDNIAAITEDLKIVSGRIREGKGTLSELINNPSIADNVRRGTMHFRTATINTEKAISKVNEYLLALNTKGTLINELTTDTVAFADFKEAVRQFKDASMSISDFAGNIERAGNTLNKTDNVVGALLNDKQIADDLKDITRNLNASSQKLDEDLEGLQHNFLLRGYFKKQEKEKKKKSNESQNTNSEK